MNGQFLLLSPHQLILVSSEGVKAAQALARRVSQQSGEDVYVYRGNFTVRRDLAGNLYLHDRDLGQRPAPWYNQDYQKSLREGHFS